MIFGKNKKEIAKPNSSVGPNRAQRRSEAARMRHQSQTEKQWKIWQEWMKQKKAIQDRVKRQQGAAHARALKRKENEEKRNKK